MALYAMADNGIDIPASSDGAMYNVMFGGQDFIISGNHNEMEVTSSANSFIVTLGTGEAVICGRHVVEITENGTNTQLQLDANDSGYLVLRFDLTKPAGQETYLATTNILQNDDLNAGGSVHDLLLYSYVTNGSGVSSLTDQRKMMRTVAVARSISKTLVSSTWSTNVYTLSDSAIESGKQIAVICPSSATDAEYNAYVNALIRVSAVSNGSLTLKAMRIQPTINLPIELLILG